MRCCMISWRGGGGDQLLLAGAHPCVQRSVAARLRHRQHQATQHPQYPAPVLVILQQMCPAICRGRGGGQIKQFAKKIQTTDRAKRYFSLYPTPTLIGGEGV